MENDNTDKLKDTILDKVIRKCFASPVDITLLTPPKRYQTSSRTVHVNSPNGIIAMKIPDEIQNLMKGQRILLQVTLIKDRVWELKHIPNIDMHEKDKNGHSICLGGPDTQSKPGYGNNVEFISSVYNFWEKNPIK